MIKILHSADWHLDSPLLGRTEAQTQLLRQALLSLPERIAELCCRERCDIMLLSGDLFDGPYTQESYLSLRNALEAVKIPVFIAPGNHDPATPGSPWLEEIWPENVHIFTRPVIDSLSIPELNCRIYGAGFDSIDCPGLLEGFHADQTERYAIGILHGDPTQTASPYCPVTGQQLRRCGLIYLALGHIHKGGSLSQDKTLCAWPGCPMGRGYDEQGQKGVLISTVGETVDVRFVPLGFPQFFDLTVVPDDDPVQALDRILPPVPGNDFYRVTFTGTAEKPNLPALEARFSHFPNLELRDRTLPPPDIWRSAGEDSLEGVFFQLLLDSLENKGEEEQCITRLAAKIARQILDGQEVLLP